MRFRESKQHNDINHSDIIIYLTFLFAFHLDVNNKNKLKTSFIAALINSMHFSPLLSRRLPCKIESSKLSVDKHTNIESMTGCSGFVPIYTHYHFHTVYIMH